MKVFVSEQGMVLKKYSIKCHPGGDWHAGNIANPNNDHPQACENTAKRPKMYGVNWSAHIELRRPINPFETVILKHVFPQLEGCDLEGDLINNHHQLCL